MNEMRTHIIAAMSVLILLILPFFMETHPGWLFSVIMIVVIMVYRSTLGEIQRKVEMIIDLIIVAIFVFTSVWVSFF